MYSGMISNKTPDYHLDDQALIFFREEPSREQPERPQESPVNFQFRVKRYKSIELKGINR